MKRRETLMIVDDEPHIINALKRLLLDNDFNVLSAKSAAEGLVLIQQHEIDVVIADYCMPGRNGVELLSLVKILSPSTERILMTAFATIDTAIEAINSGEVFRFIIKPWDNKLLLNAIDDCLMHQRLVNILKLGEERMFHTMARMVELKDPYTRGHCQRVANCSVTIAGVLGLNKTIKKEILWGAWLHDCGKVGVPEKILNFPGKLSEHDLKFIHKHPEWGASVVSEAGLSQQVINIIMYHHEHLSGGGYPLGLKGKEIPLEARIVAVADVFDALSTDRPYRPGFSMDKVRVIMAEMRGDILDPELHDILFDNFDKVFDEMYASIETNSGIDGASAREANFEACHTRVV